VPWKIGGKIDGGFSYFLAGTETYATKEEAEAVLVSLVLRGVIDTSQAFIAVEVKDDEDMGFDVSCHGETA
jgi:hypothetical protein